MNRKDEDRRQKIKWILYLAASIRGVTRVCEVMLKYRFVTHWQCKDTFGICFSLQAISKMFYAGIYLTKAPALRSCSIRS